MRSIKFPNMFNSNNTRQLSIPEIKEAMYKLEYIKQELAKED